MQRYEYRVIPAPARGEKSRGAKTAEDRYAHALAAVMNELGREGWEYLRAETLPSEERTGFTKRNTVYVNVLVFRRPASEAAPAPAVAVPAQKSFLRFGRLPGARAAAEPAGKAPLVERNDEGPAPRLGPAKDDR